MADDVQVANRRLDASENEALIGMARMGADAFGYTADLRIDRGLAQLLRLRVSQLNNCTYCLNLHYEARARRASPGQDRHADRVVGDRASLRGRAGSASLHRGAHPRRRHRPGRGVSALPRRARRALQPGGDPRDRRRRRQHERLDPAQACRGCDAGPGLSSAGATAKEITGLWWLWLIAGIAWGVIALVILQFDSASITTVGVLVGAMFTFAAVQNFALVSVPGAVRWVSALFGVMFLIAAVLCFISPENTFVALADTVGFLFLLVGLWWMVRAFLERATNTLWWLGLISGILMTILAFWTGGQFFIEKAYVLLVFAGIWALMASINDIVRAFVMLRAHQEL